MAQAPKLIAVDGVSGRALTAAARRLAPGKTARVSRWDASGVFEQLVVDADAEVSLSPRLLLLLYAADLAFRLRWEIDPMLAAGHSVVAAPYVDTAVAFGRACGLPPAWLKRLFSFAPKPGAQHVVGAAAAARGADGFVEFGCEHVRSLDSRSVATLLKDQPRSRRGTRARRPPPPARRRRSPPRA
jgi:hypothetical protein